MKKKLYALLLTGILLCGLAACGAADDVNTAINTPAPTKEVSPEQNTPEETPIPATVDYSNDITAWIYQPESEDAVIQQLKKIDNCRYGSAGASLDQVSSAVALLNLTKENNVDASLQTYLDGMDATQLDYFSFQWQMNLKKAGAMLSSPETYAGLLDDSGNTDVALESYDAKQLEELNQVVVSALTTSNVKDVWKEHTDLEPFFLWAEQTETTKAGNVISPLPVTIDMNNLDNCTVHVSFNKGDAYVDDTGVMRLKVKVYTYDLYDMVDISTLAEGDTIILRGKEVLITSLVRTEYGAVQINGGLDVGGYELITDESTVYFETGYSDVKSYYELGETTLKVSGDFIFTDKMDLDKGAVTYYPGDFLTDEAGIFYHFVPDNTTIVIQDGQVIAMERIYTP